MKIRSNGTRRGADKMSVGCAVLFAIPFFCVGIGTGVGAVQHFMKHRGFAELLPWVLLVFHVVFTGIGVGIPWATIRGAKAEKKYAADLEANTDTLWLMREDWASGRIDYDGSGAVKGMLFFAFIWNAISWPATYGAITQEFLAKGKKEALIVLLFPIVGLALIGAVVYGFIQARRFGKSRFVMENIPGVIGTVMRGIVVTGVDRSLASEVPFVVRLTCFRRQVTGSGKNRNVRNIPLWHDERKFKGTPRRDDPTKLAVPVEFGIPSDAESVTLENKNNRILWELKISADVPGVDYGAEFELPVFRTPDSPEVGAPVIDDGASNVAFESMEEEKEAISAPQGRGISMMAAGGGAGVAFRFAPLRNIGPVIGLFVFQCIWGGAIWFMIDKGAPIFFPIVFGGFLVLLFLVWMSMIVMASKVTATHGSVSVIRGPFGMGQAKKVRVEDIKSIAVTSGMQSGQTHYYDLFIRHVNGKKVKICSSIKDRDEAEFIAYRIARAVGLADDQVRTGRGSTKAKKDG